MVVVGVFVLAKYLLPPQLQMLCTSAFIGVGRGIVRVVVVEIENSVEKHFFLELKKGKRLYYFKNYST